MSTDRPEAAGAEGAALPRRRRFTVEYELRILRELDACAERGDRTAIVEREDLLWSHVAKWRRQREVGALEDSWMELSSQARLLQLAQERDALLDEIDELRRENVELRRQATTALLPHRLRDGLARLLGRRPGPPADEPADGDS
jgi:hypothetical protein